MSTHEDIALACTLGAGAMGPRLEWIRRVTAESLVSFQLDGQVLRLTYRPQAARDIGRIVELERACCAFLDFSLDTSENEVVLTISAPERARDDALWLFAQFIPESGTVGASSATCDCCAKR